MSTTERRLGLRKRGKQWWITGVPEYYVDEKGPYTDCGPYDNKVDAEEDRQGMEKSLKEIDQYEERPRRERASSKKTVKPKEEVVNANRIVKTNEYIRQKKKVPKRVIIKDEEEGLW